MAVTGGSDSSVKLSAMNVQELLLIAVATFAVVALVHGMTAPGRKEQRR